MASAGYERSIIESVITHFRLNVMNEVALAERGAECSFDLIETEARVPSERC